MATVVSGIIGYWSIAFLLNYLKKHTTYLFIFYRLVLGAFLLVLLLSHKIEPFDKEDNGGTGVKPVVKAVEETVALLRGATATVDHNITSSWTMSIPAGRTSVASPLALGTDCLQAARLQAPWTYAERRKAAGSLSLSRM